MSKIWIVDAFTYEPYRVNPAGIMIIEDFFEDVRCQAIRCGAELVGNCFCKAFKGQPLSYSLVYSKGRS